MFISKEFRFESAHFLPRHNGKCRELHGHSFRLIVEIYGDLDTNTGFLMDYAELSGIVDPIVKRIDHRLLNCYCTYPSSENLVIWFAHELIGRMPGQFALYRSRLVIKLSETEKTWAVWDSANSTDLAHLDDDRKAEWRSPDPGITGGENPFLLMDKVKRMLEDASNRYFGLLTTREQLRLYIDTVDWQPKLSELTEQGKSNDGKTR